MGGSSVGRAADGMQSSGVEDKLQAGRAFAHTAVGRASASGQASAVGAGRAAAGRASASGRASVVGASGVDELFWWPTCYGCVSGQSDHSGGSLSVTVGRTAPFLLFVVVFLEPVAGP